MKTQSRASASTLHTEPLRKKASTASSSVVLCSCIQCLLLQWSSRGRLLEERRTLHNSPVHTTMDSANTTRMALSDDGCNHLKANRSIFKGYSSGEGCSSFLVVPREAERRSARISAAQLSYLWIDFSRVPKLELSCTSVPNTPTIILYIIWSVRNVSTTGYFVYCTKYMILIGAVPC